jgi:hypothetical protein
MTLNTGIPLGFEKEKTFALPFRLPNFVGNEQGCGTESRLDFQGN